MIAMRDDLIPELRRHNMLYDFLRNRVIAEAVAGQEVAAEALAQAHKDFRKNKGIDNDSTLEAFLDRSGLTQEDLNWQIALPFKIRAHCEAHFLHKAEAHFLGRKDDLDKVVYSMLRVQDPCLARELYLRIEAKEANFADLAAQYAEGVEQQTNGIVGPVSLNKSHPKLAERLGTSKAGELLEPFQISSWWLITRLERYTPAVFDEGMAQAMARELFDRWILEETSRIMAEQNPKGVATAKE